MKVLLIESATEICSVAIADGNQILSKAQASAPHQHASHLTMLIEAALEAAKVDIESIDHLALGHGPGSYTGLRVGAAVAKGICLAQPKVAFITVESMRALANLAKKSIDIPEGGLIYPTVNSRRGEVYTQPYDELATSLGNIRSEVLAETPFPELQSPSIGIVVGTGAKKVTNELAADQRLKCHPECLLHAADLHQIALEKIQTGAKEDFTTYEPLYIKPPFVTKSTKKLL